MARKIKAMIDGLQVNVAQGTTILEAARTLGINIPTLCHHSDLRAEATCRLCLVEVKGQRRLQTACNTPLKEGDQVWTTTKRVRETRKTVLELLLADHPQDCLKCVRNQNCELQKLADDYQIRKIPFELTAQALPLDDANPAIVRDLAKCIKCGRCVQVCQEVQQVGALNPAGRSTAYEITTGFNLPLADSPCVYCGQCLNVCPVGALTEKNDTGEVWRALNAKDLHVVVQTAPAVRVALGEEFGLEPGSVTTGKMVAVLKRLGFDKVFDTNFAADLTIMEEGQEFIERLQNKGTLPLITSCSPGWINYLEKFYPEFIDNVSSCKSPQQMFGAIAKTYYAQKVGLQASEIFVVSIMPCIAKKDECTRVGMSSSGVQDVDLVLTTRELAQMIKEAGLDFAALPEAKYDEPLGLSSGAAVIFGASGGVMEAALRTVHEQITGQELKKLDFKMVRGLEGFKEATLEIAGQKVKVAIANGLGQAKILLEKVKAGQSQYHFIEIMACPGGCLGGGGQPLGATAEIRAKRQAALYEIDRQTKIRKSHENPAIIRLYKEFLSKISEEEVHDLLHTSYVNRKTKKRKGSLRHKLGL